MRHRARHVQQSLFDYVESNLRTLGWFDPGGFKSRPITIQGFLSEDGKPLEGNIVAVTFGDESGELEEELGDGLVSSDTPIFVDCFGENQAVALALAEDVKDILRGRINGLSRIVPIFDYTTDPRSPAASTTAEMSDVIRVRGNDLRRTWQVVKGTATIYVRPGL